MIMDSSLQKRVWILCYADMTCAFKFVLHFVECDRMTVSLNQIIIIITIIIINFEKSISFTPSQSYTFTPYVSSQTQIKLTFFI